MSIIDLFARSVATEIAAFYVFPHDRYWRPLETTVEPVNNGHPW